VIQRRLFGNGQILPGDEILDEALLFAEPEGFSQTDAGLAFETGGAVAERRFRLRPWAKKRGSGRIDPSLFAKANWP
jgi:hypothetical protein